MNNFKDFFYERYGGYKLSQKTYYHGTSTKNLRNILKTGLIINPKNRAWNSETSQSKADFSNPSLQSISNSIYLTTSLNTALMAGYDAISNNADDVETVDLLIVCMEITDRMLKDDEDTLIDFIDQSVSKDQKIIILNTKNYFTRNETADKLKEFNDNIIKWASPIRHNLNQLKYSAQEKQAIYKLIPKLYIATLLRQASYIKELSNKYNLNIANRENKYNEILDKFSSISKIHRKYELSPINTARATQDIKFSGDNKIICIFTINDFALGMNIITPVINYGILPDNITTEIQNYNNKIIKQHTL